MLYVPALGTTGDMARNRLRKREFAVHQDAAHGELKLSRCYLDVLVHTTVTSTPRPHPSTMLSTHHSPQPGLPLRGAHESPDVARLVPLLVLGVGWWVGRGARACTLFCPWQTFPESLHEVTTSPYARTHVRRQSIAALQQCRSSSSSSSDARALHPSHARGRAPVVALSDHIVNKHLQHPITNPSINSFAPPPRLILFVDLPEAQRSH